LRLCRFNEDRLGVATCDTVLDVTDALRLLPSCPYPWPPGDILIRRLPELRREIEAQAARAKPIRLEDVKLLSPVANPGKIMAAPVNYPAHLDEARTEPALHHQNRIDEIHRVGLFLKATSSLVGASQGVELSFPERRNDHEIELVVIIGRTARHVRRDEALDCVAGYCIGLDMTLRGPEERSLRKSIDGYSVLGPWLVTADELRDPSNLNMTLSVNGEVRQRANTRDLIIDVADLIVFASSYYTLQPGDVLFTGTPEGVGPVVAGDCITAEIDRIGIMRVEIRSTWRNGGISR
jgi:2,4-didehydro-3-deoxy-L-rhamnonate hydrolase